MAADASPLSAPGGGGAAMELIAELEAQLERAQAEKERLQRDVDELCKQQVGQGLLGVAFGSSEAVARIHARRVSGLEDQVRGWKAQAAELTKQAAEMQAEIRELHRAKTLSQQALREAEERTRLVRAEVAYFQDQVAGALSQRDEALLEIEQAKEQCEKALEDAMQAKEQCEQAQEEREQAMKELVELKAEVAKFLQEEHSMGQPNSEESHPITESDGGNLGQGGVKDTTNVPESSLVDTEPADAPRSGELDEPDTDQQSLGEEKEDLSAIRPRDGPDTSSTLEAERAGMRERISALDLQVQTLSQENAKLRAKLQTQIEAAEAANKRIEMHTHGSDIDAERQGEGDSVSRALDQEVGAISDRSSEEDLRGGSIDAHASLLERSTVHEESGPTSEATSAKVRELEAELNRLRAEAEVERAKWREELVKAYGPEKSMQTEQAETMIKPESVGLLGASSALQAQLSKLLNEPDTFRTSESLQANQALPPKLQPETLADSTVDISSLTPLEASASAKSTAPSETLRMLAETSAKPLDLSDDFDVRKALAQAAQEKVAALVLLSQQEERHEMELRQNQNLQARLGEVQERLAEVVQEKVAALMQVAELREEVLNLKDTESRLAALLQPQQGGSSLSSRLLPAAWAKPPTAKDESHQEGAAPVISPSPSTASLEERDRSSPAKAGWLSAISKAASVPGSRRPSNGTESGREFGGTTERWYKGWIPRPNDVSKRPVKSDGWSSGEETSSLRVENAALQERVATIQRLTESVHRLRTRLTEAVSRASENEDSVRAALDAVGSVVMEAGQLKVALGGALPVSYSETAEGSASENESGEKSAADTAGLEIVELLIVAASLQREVLQKR